MIDASTLGPELCALGKLVGLLKDGPEARTVVVDTSWFANPVASLEQVDARLGDLVSLFALILETRSPGPQVFSGASWYVLPNIATGAATPFCIVAPAPGASAGEIGVGALVVSGAAATVSAFMYAPLFTFDPSGARWVGASDAHPVQIGIDAVARTPFEVGAVTFSALQLRAQLYLSGAVPTTTITFVDLSGTTKPSTYTSLASLLDPAVLAWLGEVLVRTSPWLGAYLGNAPYAVGDVLESAHFLARDYHLAADNLLEVQRFAATLSAQADPVSTFLWGRFSPAVQGVLANPDASVAQLQQALLEGLGPVLQGASIYGVDRFTDVVLRPQTIALLAQNPEGSALLQLNRLLLQDVYPGHIVPGPWNLDLQNLQGDSALQIALGFAFAVLDALAASPSPLVFLPGGGISIARQQNHDDSVDYGLDIAVVLALGSAPDRSDGPPSPEVSLVLGTWFSGETDASNWYTRITGKGAQRGINLFALHRTAAGALSFAPRVRVVSAGLDVRGGGNAALVDVQGYSIGGAELRAYVDSDGWDFGFAARVDRVGFPLAPGFSTTDSGSGNLVAKNLLASGTPSESGDPTRTSATNPAFSAELGYVRGCAPLLQLFGPDGQATDVVWFPVQKRFGPINCSKIGVRVDVGGRFADDPLLGVLFDGGVEVAALSVYLQQLEIDLHLKRLGDISGYSLDLQGIEVELITGGVEIAGGLLKHEIDGQTFYDGEAILKAEGFGLSALGSFGTLPGGGTSLFVFALANIPLGGPGFFFVTGLSAGFGYNRRLILPQQEQLPAFPLVGGLTNPKIMGGASPTPRQVLATLDDWVVPERGQYWLAAGVQFTTYEIINTTALAIVEVGNEFSVALIGSAILKQLPGEVAKTFVYAELDIAVVFRPGEGELRASASLAPSSFLLFPSVHLTGGFAFYAWFGQNLNAGDFAFTIGGYHPAFDVPLHYPRESRVGINWKVSDSVQLTGGAYFAITPAALMAGAGMALTYQSGALRAWLKASIDAIVYFKPFYVDAEISVSVGASYRMKVWFVDKTFSVEVGAAFQFYGPPVGARVQVNWYIISFSIEIGPKRNPPSNLTWDDFKGLLPSKTTVHDDPAGLETTVPAYLHVRAVSGLLRTQQQGDTTLWLVRAGDFAFEAGSALPSTQIVISDRDGGRTLPGAPVGVQRLNGGIAPANYQATQTITVREVTVPGAPGLADMRSWTVEAVSQGLPQAIYGTPSASGRLDPNPRSRTVTATTGARMTASLPIVDAGTPAMNVDVVFAERVVNAGEELVLGLSPAAPAVNITPAKADSFLDIAGIDSPAVAGARARVFAALQAMGLAGWTNDPLPELASRPGQAFADEPLEGSTIPVQGAVR